MAHAGATFSLVEMIALFITARMVALATVTAITAPETSRTSVITSDASANRDGLVKTVPFRLADRNVFLLVKFAMLQVCWT
jgi:hypothetical protein